MLRDEPRVGSEDQNPMFQRETAQPHPLVLPLEFVLSLLCSPPFSGGGEGSQAQIGRVGPRSLGRAALGNPWQLPKAPEARRVGGPGLECTWFLSHGLGVGTGGSRGLEGLWGGWGWGGGEWPGRGRSRLGGR